MTDALVGGTATGDRVYVSATVTVTEPRDGIRTVEHDTHTGPVVRLSMVGLIVSKGCRNAHAAGQVLDVLDHVTVAEAPFTIGDVRSLVSVWRAWHLNDMRAACAHLPRTVDASGPTNTWPVCGASGYRYGHAWLYEPIPADGSGRLPGDPLAVLRFIAGRTPAPTRYAGN